jgi:hypothetical protein
MVVLTIFIVRKTTGKRQRLDGPGSRSGKASMCTHREEGGYANIHGIRTTLVLVYAEVDAAPRPPETVFHVKPYLISFLPRMRPHATLGVWAKL